VRASLKVVEWTEEVQQLLTWALDYVDYVGCSGVGVVANGVDRSVERSSRL
jgi:hypothetical protein